MKLTSQMTLSKDLIQNADVHILYVSFCDVAVIAKCLRSFNHWAIFWESEEEEPTQSHFGGSNEWSEKIL